MEKLKEQSKKDKRQWEAANSEFMKETDFQE